jgi:DNA-binding CsgD family transcriptional regulator
MDRRDTHFDHLVDAIYDAGACPERWPSVLTTIGAAAGAEGGVMFGVSKSRGFVFEYNGALDPHSVTVFKARHANNAWVQSMAQQPQNQLVVSDSLIKHRQLMKSEFYDEVLRPQRLAHGALATLTAGGDIDIQFSVEKSVHRGPFNARELNLLRRIVPHVRRALGVSVRLMPGVSMANCPESIIDRLGCAAVTLNCRGEIVEANGIAQRFAGSGLLPLSRSGLMLSDPCEQRRFLVALKAVCGGASLRTLVLTHGTGRFEVVCLTFDPHRTYWSSQAPCQTAAVLVLFNRLSACSPAFADSRGPFACGLTAAERRVAKVAASGISNAQVASVLGVSLNTVKTHLRRVYSKLDVKKQSELVIRFNCAGVDSE